MVGDGGRVFDRFDICEVRAPVKVELVAVSCDGAFDVGLEVERVFGFRCWSSELDRCGKPWPLLELMCVEDTGAV